MPQVPAEVMVLVVIAATGLLDILLDAGDERRRRSGEVCTAGAEGAAGAAEAEAAEGVAGAEGAEAAEGVADTAGAQGAEVAAGSEGAAGAESAAGAERAAGTEVLVLVLDPCLSYPLESQRRYNSSRPQPA